jgi:hypothetical protein
LRHQPLTDKISLLRAAAPALRPAPEELRAFWRELLNARLMHGGKVLQLAANTSFLGKPALGQNMMVRECYVRLWEKVEEDFRGGEYGRVIIGTPGESGV